MRQLDMNFYLINLRMRYAKAGRNAKCQILNEFCETSGCHRKHAIRLLTKTPLTVRKSPPGRMRLANNITHLQFIYSWINCGSSLVTFRQAYATSCNCCD